MIDINTLPPEEREFIVARREYKRKWREANREEIKEYNKRFYEKTAQKSANGGVEDEKTV